MSTSTENLAHLSSAVSAALKRLAADQFSSRLWQKDPSLWKADPSHHRIIKNALGWLTVVDPMVQRASDLVAFGKSVREQSFTHAVLLGMGGSSLCVEVLRQSFAPIGGCPAMQVLDSTDPAAVRTVENQIDRDRTLFIVASKSGTTVEVSSFYRYFFEKIRARRQDAAGQQFIAITDPGTFLEKLGRERSFLQVFLNPADIGGRFSALSLFGLVPAAIMGLDVSMLLSRAQTMVKSCSPELPAEQNPGVRLGVILAEAARAGRDKVTLFTSLELATFGLWVEQLIAESTGKEGKGIIPIDGEPVGHAAVYGRDRLFVELTAGTSETTGQESLLRDLEKAGHPVVRIRLTELNDLGAEFFRWEFATAVAGSVLGINAFDQPNVQESKDNTNRLLEEFRQSGQLPTDAPFVAERGLSVFCSAEYRTRLEKSLNSESGNVDFAACLAAHFGQVRPGDYIALNAYLDPSTENQVRLRTLRQQLRDRFRVATTVGFGPRFLHSTGQLHKGGPDSGVFIQITADDLADLAIPGEPYSFSVLKQAQALGDFQSLATRHRRAIRVHLGSDITSGLKRLIELIR